MTTPPITGAREALAAALRSLWYRDPDEAKVDAPAFLVGASGKMRFGSAKSCGKTDRVTEDLSDPIQAASLKDNAGTIDSMECDAAYVLERAQPEIREQWARDREDNMRMDRADEAFGGYE